VGVVRRDIDLGGRGVGVLGGVRQRLAHDVIHGDDIRELIATRDPAVRRAALERRHADLTDRIARARASLALIESALDCDHEDFTGCPHFRAAAARRAGLEPPAGSVP
jgi:hypothetical protein